MGEPPNKEYFSKLFERHSGFVYRTAFALTKSSTQADDITQETFIRVIQKFHTYDSSKPIEPWLYKITVNITRNMLRKLKLLRLIGMEAPLQESEFVEETVLYNESKAELWKEILQLPRKSREVVILHFYTGLTLVEIAEVLSIPLGTCKSRLHYALKILRKNKSAFKKIIQMEET